MILIVVSHAPHLHVKITLNFELGLDLRVVIPPLLQCPYLELELRKDVVLVEDGIFPVSIRIKQRQYEVRVPSLVTISKDFG